MDPIKTRRYTIHLPSSQANIVDRVCKKHGCDPSHVISILIHCNFHNLTFEKMERQLDLLNENWFSKHKEWIPERE